MNTNILELIEYFLENYYRKDIICRTDNVLVIDFNQVISYSLELSDYILEHPEEAIAKFNLFMAKIKGVQETECNIRFFNLPVSNHVKVSDIRMKHVNAIKVVEGNISKITDVIATLTCIHFECIECGNHIKINQNSDKRIVPTRCSCGRRGFRVIKEEMENVQKFMLEDFIMERSGSYKPVQKMVLLKKTLADPEVTYKVQPGVHVQIIGIVKSKEVSKDSVERDFYIEANNIIIKDKSLYSLPISPAEVEQIKLLSEDPKILSRLAQSISPGTKGMMLIRKALVIQHFRSDNVFDEKNSLDDRGTINIALVANPGTNKTYMAKKAIQINPISMMTSGRGLSGVGLIATVSFDKMLNSWTLDPGAVPICNKGIIMIDEADKIDEDDIGFLNNAMNDLLTPINKANVRAMLETDVSFLCCWNPEHRVFVDTVEKFRQLKLPADFLDRFDLIFGLEASNDEEERKGVIKKIINRHKGETKPDIDRDLFTKYVAYAWQNIHPTIDDELTEYLELKINEIMDPSMKKKSEVSYRIIGTVLRLSKAIARVYLSNEIRKQDVDFAIKLLMESFMSLEMIDQSNRVTFESFERAPAAKSINEFESVRRLFDMAPDAILSIEEIEKEMQDLTGSELDQILDKLKQSGEIFEPKRNMFKRL